MTDKHVNFKISFTGMMLALIILFQYLEKFMPFGSAADVMKFNLSLIFIMATLFILDFKWAVLLLILRFLIGPALSGNYIAWNVWGHFILLVSGSVYMLTFYFSNKLLDKIFRKKWETIGSSAIISIVISSLILTLLNGLLFSPVYFWLFGAPDATIENAKKFYQGFKFAFFGIPNYWGGMFAVFMTGNIIKFTIISIGFVGLWRVVKHLS